MKDVRENIRVVNASHPEVAGVLVAERASAGPHQLAITVVDGRTALARLVVTGGKGFVDDVDVWSQEPVAWGDAIRFVVYDVEQRDLDVWSLVCVIINARPDWLMR